MTEPRATFSQRPHIAIQTKAMELESGYLGKFFGSSKNAPLNIAGLVLMALMIPGVVLLFTTGQLPAAEYWKLITPAVTLILGYIFGRKTD